GDVAEVDVDVIVGGAAGEVAVGVGGDVVGELFSEIVVLLDHFPRLHDGGADAVDVGGGAPHVRRGAAGHLVRRRAVATVDGDVHGGAGRGAELLEVEGQHAHGAGDVARKLLQARRLLEVDQHELVEAEVRRQADARGRLVRRHLVKVARQAVPAAL